MTAARTILGCSSATSNTLLRAELETCPPKTNRDARKVEMAIPWYGVRNMPKKKVPAIVDGAIVDGAV